LKRVASLFIASLTSSAVTVRFEPLAYYGGRRSEDPDQDAAKFANAEIENLLEKFKFEYRVREALVDGAVTGDYCAHFWFDPEAQPYGGTLGEHLGEIQMELVDGINVLFENPNDRDVEHQPYIILVGRDTVGNLRNEARRHRRRKGASRKASDGGAEDLNDAAFQPDSETQDFPGIGGQTEIEPDDEDGKALYVLLYTKEEREVTETGPDGLPRKRKETTVHVTKSTRSAIIYENVDTGLSLYPIAWGNWETRKNQYHGQALITGLIPNQVFINRMFAMAMRHMQLMAFPKIAYNADLISVWTNEPGEVIGIRHMLPGQTIPQVASVLQTPEMSGQLFTLIDKAIAYTKECLGATDAQMGNVRPDNTSALMVLQTNAEVPLENIRAGIHEWVEDIAHILLDFMGTYYGRRPVIVEKEFREFEESAGGVAAIDPMTGLLAMNTVRKSVIEEYDFSVCKSLWLKLRVDVGATSYFSQIALIQTLDNLRKEGALDLVQYLERVPDQFIPRKEELIEALKKSAQAELPTGGTGISPGVGTAQGGEIAPDKAVSGVPDGVTAALNRIPQKLDNLALRQAARKI
ncbi:MAG: hypothetical protein IJT94_04990, partial [Oscillibacter sp.]|nr:hypothetical protein [Oscillibacter sp.]